MPYCCPNHREHDLFRRRGVIETRYYDIEELVDSEDEVINTLNSEWVDTGDSDYSNSTIICEICRENAEYCEDEDGVEDLYSEREDTSQKSVKFKDFVEYVNKGD